MTVGVGHQAGASVGIPAVLSDGTLLLRPPRSSDADLVTRGCQDREIARWTTVPVPYDLADARAWIAERAPQGPLGRQAWWAYPTWAITSGDDLWCGTVDLRLDGQGGAEVGFLVASWARGKGLATASLRLACRWGFSTLGLQVIQWHGLVGNEASRRVAAHVGFRIHAEPARLSVARRGERSDAWFGDLLPADLGDGAAGRRRPQTGPHLTTREQEVLDLMAAGGSNRRIAEHLRISENTVKNHVRRILEKFQANSRMEAVVIGVQRGLTTVA